MNHYETMYIIRPTVAEEERTALIARFSDLIAANGGSVTGIEEMGTKKLAYEIDYIGEGFYVLVNFDAPPALPAELERNFKISDAILRYLVVRKEA